MQSPPDSPMKVSPLLQIELSQSENEFYHPGGLVSGHVRYAHHHHHLILLHHQEVDNFELTMTFFGVNRTFVSKLDNEPFQEAVLFKYETSLHNGAAPRNRSGQQYIAPMEFYFKWRFPSVAENRQFSQCFGAVGGHIWENSRHSLPPSFDGAVPSENAKNGFKHCSVEYSLEAQLCHNKTLVATKKLPIVFLPSRTPFIDPRSNITFSYSPVLNMEIEKRYSLFEDQSYSFRVQCPKKIVQGRPFNVSIFAPFDPLSLSDDFVSRLMRMEITRLAMVCTTSVRAAGAQTGHTLSPTSQEERRSEWRQFRPTSLVCQPQPRVNADGSQELEFTFEASMPSYYHPTFRTFLIANNYCFESPIEIRVDGRTIELPLTAPHFAVLSCFASVNTKRPSFMTTPIPAS